MSALYLKASEIIETLDEYNGQSGLFFKTFALNDKRNKNGWRAVWEGIKKNIHTFLDDGGRPGIEYVKCEQEKCDLDHTDGQTKEESIQVQEPFRQSTIIDFTLDENTHTAFFIHRAKNKEFYSKIKSGKIKYVSPSIWPKPGGFDVVGQMENGLPMIDVYDWDGLHDAFVNNPAFGDDAKITATCEGESCPMRLLSARQLKSEITDELAPLKEVPLLIRHKNKLQFISITQQHYEKLKQRIDAGEKLDENLVKQVTAMNACNCSANTSLISQSGQVHDKMTPEEHEKKLESMKKAMDEKDEKIKTLESKLKGMEEDHKKLESKLKAAEENSDDEKVKQAQTEKEKAEEESKKAKKAQEETEKENKELKAKIAEPLIAAIIKRRQEAGMPKEQLEKLQTSLSAKSIDEIEEKYNEDRFLMNSLSASSENIPPKHFEFSDTGPQTTVGQLAAKSLEEEYGEMEAKA